MAPYQQPDREQRPDCTLCIIYRDTHLHKLSKHLRKSEEEILPQGGNLEQYHTHWCKAMCHSTSGFNVKDEDGK